MVVPIVVKSLRSTFRSLESRNYRWFWLSALAAFTSMQMQVFVRGWLVYDLTGSSLALGWVSFAFGIPVMLLSPLGGTITDRVDKRNLLITTQILAGITNLVIAVLISVGAIEVWHLIVSATLTGVLFAFNTPGRQSMIPELVEREQLMNAIALSIGAMNLTRIFAPALSGILVAIIGIDWVYYITVAFFGISAVLLFAIPPMGKTPRDATSTIKSEILQGFSYVRNSPVLLSLLALAFIPIVFGMPYQMLMPAFAVDVLDVGASGLGFLMAAIGVGALIGSLSIASLGNFRHKGLLLYGALIVFGAFLVGFAGSNNYYLSVFLLLGIGAASTSYMATNNTMIHLNVTDDMRGRIMGIYMITIGLFPLGVLPISAIAEVIGVQLAVGVSGAFLVLFTLMMAMLRPGLRKL
ncbi:MFS transporter [Chloroflexota bacterium]